MVPAHQLSKQHVRFGILMFEGHPLGRCMLEECKLQNIAPTVVIEAQSKVGRKRAAWFDRQMASARPDLPTVANLIDVGGASDLEDLVHHHFVKSVNGDDCCSLLTALNLDIMFLGGIGIVKDRVLDCARHGAVNCHPGLLPWVQGSLPVARSLVLGVPIASSAHRVSSELDKGALIDISFVDRERCGNRFEDIIYASCTLAARQVVEVIAKVAVSDKVPHCDTLSSDEGECFVWDDNIEEDARRVLEVEQQPAASPASHFEPHNASASVVVFPNLVCNATLPTAASRAHTASSKL